MRALTLPNVLLLLACSIGSRGSACPEDSVALEDGGCKCVSPCPPDDCRAGQRPIEVRAASPETPGSCCPLYNCIPSESVSWARTEEGQGAGNCMDVSGVPRSATERWQEGPCVNCVCEEGNVSCQATMCRSCENPVPAAPGECCPHCPPLQNATGTLRDHKCEPLRNCELHCPDGYQKDEKDCPTCSCSAREKPTTEDRICPELPHCHLDCELVKDKGGCSVCVCETSLPKVLVQKNDNRTVCPALSCDLHCEHGLVNDENGCTLCECKEQVGCAALTDCKKKCSFGLKTSKRGCQMCRCRATCVDHRNETHPEGSSWMPNSCTTCVCDSIGRLSCRETVCSVACSDPQPPEPGACCPVCPITVSSSTEVTLSHQNSRGWGTAPITVIVVLAVFCVLLMMHIVRSRFRGRLSPSEASYASYPPQYYKCVPVYDTPVHRSEKIIPL